MRTPPKSLTSFANNPMGNSMPRCMLVTLWSGPQLIISCEHECNMFLCFYYDIVARAMFQNIETRSRRQTFASFQIGQFLDSLACGEFINTAEVWWLIIHKLEKNAQLNSDSCRTLDNERAGFFRPRYHFRFLEPPKSRLLSLSL